MIFFCILIFLLGIVLIFNHGDIICPNSVFILSLTLCSGLLMLYYKKWNLSISVGTYVTYITGASTFIIFGELGKYLIKSIRFTRNRDGVRNEIRISSMRVCGLIVLTFIGIVFSYQFLKTFSSSIIKAISIYRNGLTAGRIAIPFLPSQIYKITNAASYISVYILAYNLSRKCRLHNYGILVIYVILSLFDFYIFSGGRQGIIELVIFGILSFNIHRRNLEKKTNYKRIMKYAGLAILIVPLFYYSSQLVGRNFERIRDFSPLEYITRYLGGGLVALDTIVKKATMTQHWGQSSFANIYAKLVSMGVLSDSIENMSFHDFFQYGNTVTIFGRWYEDWGIWGVIIMSALVGYFYNALYMMMKKVIRKNQAVPSLYVVLYSKLILGMFWAGYDDRVCQMLSFSYILIIIITIMFYHLMVDKMKRKIVLKSTGIYGAGTKWIGETQK